MMGCGRSTDAGIATIGKYARPSFNREFTRPPDLSTHVLSQLTASRVGTGKARYEMF